MAADADAGGEFGVVGVCGVSGDGTCSSCCCCCTWWWWCVVWGWWPAAAAATGDTLGTFGEGGVSGERIPAAAALCGMVLFSRTTFRSGVGKPSLNTI